MVTIKVLQNGPYLVDGDATLVDWNGVAYVPRKRPFALCRCGASKHKPCCDGSHKLIAFAATGEPASGAFEALAVRNGTLGITPQKNGPLAITGNLEILSGTGRTIMKTTSARFCRCGHSQNKPYCDGTHARVGFVT